MRVVATNTVTLAKFYQSAFRMQDGEVNVTAMNATVAAIKAAGGSMTGDPRPFGSTGIVIGTAIDPPGNRIDLITRP